MEKGVFEIKNKAGASVYRASVTYKGRHISLGSFEHESAAAGAYAFAKEILYGSMTLFSYIDLYKSYENKAPDPAKEKSNQTDNQSFLPFTKAVTLLNFRDRGVYIKNPIYLEKSYFLYFYSVDTVFTFDTDDLFYYSKHAVQMRGGHIFTEQYGSQINIMSRYGIKPFQVRGRDYVFANGDPYDMRYSNIKIINNYRGVTSVAKNGITTYVTKIHINGDIIVGRYRDETEAAVAYNKAAMILNERGVKINFVTNYIDTLSDIEYISLLNRVRVADTIRNYDTGKGK